MEAEYIALSQSMRDLIPLQGVIKEIYTKMLKKEFTSRCSTHSKAFFETIEEEYPSRIAYEDNTACLQFVKMPKLSPRTKHIGLPYQWFRNKVSSLEIDIQAVSSADQLEAHYWMTNAQKHEVSSYI